MTPLLPVVAAALGGVGAACLLRANSGASPLAVAFAAWSTAGSGLVTALAALLLPERPDLVGLVALQAVALDLAGLAVLVGRAAPRRRDPAAGRRGDRRWRPVNSRRRRGDGVGSRRGGTVAGGWRPGAKERPS